ncbi:hypothetical protein ACHAXT_003407 [Thalassiosira profunda]
MAAGIHSASKKFSTVNTVADKEVARLRRHSARLRFPVFYPWTRPYKSWWGLTVFGAALTIFLETYQIAFAGGGYTGSGSAVLEFILLAIFGCDIFINFNLAYYDERDRIVFDRWAIAKHYLRGMFVVDLIGVFPFYLVTLQATGNLGEENDLTQYLSFLRLLKLVRLHRVHVFLSIIQYSRKLSLLTLTLMRNFGVVLVWTHVWACVMFFIAHESAFDPDNNWLGDLVPELNGFERYVTSLYWSVVTFTTVGYGDYSPVNSAEQIAGMAYMLLNVIITSWMIGSITLLIVKKDEKTGVYREALQVLHKYSALHNFDQTMTKRLRTQLKLDFDNKEIADEKVLEFFPTGVRRKILRRLYLPSLLKTRLMKDTRQQFVDSFLSLCSVEIFSPGEELLLRGNVSSDLYLLLEGTVEVSLSSSTDGVLGDADASDKEFGMSVAPTSFADESEFDKSVRNGSAGGRRIKSGDFINELGFFTESPQPDTIKTRSVCKVLTMSKSHYREIAADHPGSAGVVLQNLLSKVEDLPQNRMAVLHESISWGPEVDADADNAVAEAQAQHALTAVKDLIMMHINKQKDDHTTRFCFAASRDDIDTLAAMCDHGFDPDSSDYDRRTALMVASMNGNGETVTKLLEYHANPNLTDMHGTSALYEAVKNNHENVEEILLEAGAELAMNDSLAASTLCQTVFDGNMTLLKRLLKANIQVNAGDYDKRTASHIAASEGNAVALKLLAEAGADLTLEDRWGNTARSEAEKSKAGHVLQYLDSL